MNTLKKYFSLLFLFSIIAGNLYSTNDELYIKNMSNQIIRVDVYPIGMIYNGNQEYCLEARRPFQGIYYLKTSSVINITHEAVVGYVFDGGYEPNDEYPPSFLGGIIGYGKYRVDIYKRGGAPSYEYVFVKYCYVDYSDFDYPASYPYAYDIQLYYHSETDLRWGPVTSITDGYVCKIWDQEIIGGPTKDQNKTGFITTNVDNGIWLNFPHNAIEYGGYNHITPGLLLVNLLIDQNHEAYVKCGYSFDIANNSTL